MIRRDLYEKLDGFSADFPGGYMEDIEFKQRILKSGNSIFFIRSAIVVHPWRSAKMAYSASHLIRNKKILYSKHPELKLSTNSISIRSKILVYHLLNDLKMLFRFNLKGLRYYLNLLIFRFRLFLMI